MGASDAQGDAAGSELAHGLHHAFAAIASPVAAQDRQDELDDLRDRIQDSREKVTAHEAYTSRVEPILKPVITKVSEYEKYYAPALEALKPTLAEAAEAAHAGVAAIDFDGAQHRSDIARETAQVRT